MQQTQLSEVITANLGLIVLMPLLGSMLCYIVGKRAKDLSPWIATGASFISFLLVLKHVGSLTTTLEHNIFEWVSVGALKIDFTLRLDHLSAVMCLVVTGVGSLIHLYSVAYMAEDESKPRFFAYLNLFMFSMLLLVLGGNFLVMFVGWEGVGLCSYLLIGFWYKNISYAAAGRKAFVVNRIGDFGFLLGMFLLLREFQNLDFVSLKGLIEGQAQYAELCKLVALGLFVGACGKSAQIPLFVWLPDAMAGPTPVSALIHAATMVTAGVYMMARVFYIFDLAPEVMALVCVIALVTAFVAATTAIAQNDIKKVLAYSTVSQLGFMFLAASVGAYWVAVFHLVTHAFFKACLFLGAGSVIHGCHHEQDMRHMGGLWKKMPLTAWTYLVAVLAIAGIFPFAGYFSKHGILHALEHTQNPYLHSYAGLIVGIASLTALITAFYMMRSFAMTFLGEYKGHAHPHESPWPMTTVLGVLAFLSLVGGAYLEFGAGSLAHYLSNSLHVHVEHTESFMQVLPKALVASWVGILGVLSALFLYTKLSSLPGKIYQSTGAIGRLFSAKYYFDEIYALLIIKPLERLAQVLFRVVDQGIIDASVNGTAAIIDVNGKIFSYVQTGQIRHYALYIVAGTLFLLLFYFVL